MDFTRTRGKNATSRCINIGTYGSPLYCECGCQTPTNDDEPNIKGLSATWYTKHEPIIPAYIALLRAGENVGMMDPARQYIFIDGNEYLGVKIDSNLATLFNLATEYADDSTVTAGSTTEETAAQVSIADKHDLIDMDNRHKNHPGYCTKCHSFCYGDCEANILEEEENNDEIQSNAK